MSTKFYFVVLFFCLASFGKVARSQCEDLLYIYDSIAALGGQSPKWQVIKLEHMITLRYKEKYTLNTYLNPRKISKEELKNADSASLFVSFSFHPSPDSVIQEIKEQNKISFDILNAEYIQYYDSIGWPKKYSKEDYLANPMEFLRHFKDKDICAFVKINPLPDLRIGQCAINYGCGVDFTSMYIVQKERRKEVDDMLQKIRAIHPGILIGLEEKVMY